MLTRVFVYGTLLAGEANHRLLEGARFLGAARTEASFELRDCGSFPALVRGGACAVVGEIYEVDAETLRALDELEAHPELYERTPITLEDGSRIEAYLMTPERARPYPVIASGDWRASRGTTLRRS